MFLEETVAEATRKLLSAQTPATRAEQLSWLMFAARGVAHQAAACADALKHRHAFKTEMDAEARRSLFPRNVPSAV